MSQSVDLYRVPVKHVQEVWPHVEAMLRAAMVRTGEMKIEDLARAVGSGRFVLWVVYSGRVLAAAVTEIVETISGRICCIVACGGEGRGQWLGFLPVLEGYARTEGCGQMRIYGRKGWERVLSDYKATRVILEKGLG